MTVEEICNALIALKDGGGLDSFVLGMVESDGSVSTVSGGRPLDKLGLCQAMAMSVYNDTKEAEDAQEAIEDTNGSPE